MHEDHRNQFMDYKEPNPEVKEESGPTAKKQVSKETPESNKMTLESKEYLKKFLVTFPNAL